MDDDYNIRMEDGYGVHWTIEDGKIVSLDPSLRYDWFFQDDKEISRPSGVHFHADEWGTLRRCYHSCPSWLKIIAVSGALNLFWEVATFLPVHRLFENLGWIS